MVHWTKDHLAAYMAKFNPSPEVEDVPDPGLEGDLQGRCIRHCREHGWPVYHDFSRKKNAAGWPDLFIFKPDGKLILIELKSADGKLRKEQRELKLQLNWLGHPVYVVKSFKRFLETVKS